jgi:hypothetical protein
VSRTVAVADIPEGVVLNRDRDLAGRGYEIWIRRGLFLLLPIVALLALLNLFGQRPATTKAASSAATLKLYAPGRVRSGLIYEARFRVTAHQDLKSATLVLEPGWLESMTLNTIEPSPVNESSKNGRLSLELGHIPAGGSYLLFLQFQTNPTNVGHRSADVTLLNGDQELVHIDRSITVFP